MKNNIEETTIKLSYEMKNASVTTFYSKSYLKQSLDCKISEKKVTEGWNHEKKGKKVKTNES